MMYRLCRGGGWKFDVTSYFVLLPRVATHRTSYFKIRNSKLKIILASNSPRRKELLAGLGIPRITIELKDGIVTRKDGVVVDEAIRKVVTQILAQVKEEDIECAILKARSPTCGVHQIYDGTFSGTLTAGDGVTAELLMARGVTVFGESQIEALLK